MTEPRTFRQPRFAPPPGSTEILLVRHGESAPAVEGESFELVDGQGDPPLSEMGRTQAERVGARLSQERVDAIYVTSLCRTVETAAPLVRALGMDPAVEADLREVHLGEWEGGLFRKHVAEQHPIAVEMWREQRWDVIPGAEPSDMFAARIRAAIGRIATAHVDERVIAFSHGGVIGSILHMATGSEPWAFIGANNASISHLVVSGTSWTLRGFNDISHLND